MEDIRTVLSDLAGALADSLGVPNTVPSITIDLNAKSLARQINSAPVSEVRFHIQFF